MIKKKSLKTNPLRALGWVFFIIVQFHYSSFGQEPLLDSLRNELNRLEPTLQSSLRDSTYVNVLNDLAYEIRYKQRDSLRKLSEEALRFSKNIGYIKGEIEAYINLGNYHSDGGNHTKAAVLMNKALTKSRTYKFYSLELRAISHLAIVHDYLDKNELAFKEMLAGIDIATKLNNQKYLSLYNMNIGVLYLSLNEYSDALSYLKIAKKFGEHYRDEIILAMINSNLASAYTHSDKPETGIQVIDAAIATFENNNAPDWLAFAYTIKGKAYLQKRDYESALHWFKQSEKLYAIIDDERSETILFLAMAKTYLNLESDSISEVHAKRAYNLAEIYKDKERQKTASELLYILYKKKNDLGESFKYLEVFQQLSDTLAQDESKKSLLMFKTQLDYEQQQQDLIENNDKALAKQRNISIAILGVLLFLGAIIFLVIRSKIIQEKLNHELKKSESNLLEINATKDKLFSIIGHDLKGPITTLNELLIVMSSEKDKEVLLYTLLPRLNNYTKHVHFTLDNLLNWGKAQMKGDHIEPAKVNLHTVISNTTSLFCESVSKKELTLKVEIGSDLEVWADKDDIRVIFRNLLSNAIKFSNAQGKINISAFLKENLVVTLFEDSGVGMSQETQKRIFEMNQHHSTFGTSNEKGTGLGLMLCQELIDRNNGQIQVVSNINKGSTFSITLPRYR